MVRRIRDKSRYRLGYCVTMRYFIKMTNTLHYLRKDYIRSVNTTFQQVNEIHQKNWLERMDNMYSIGTNIILVYVNLNEKIIVFFINLY